MIANLFQKKNLILNSGLSSDFKIECDALTDKDIECLSYLISKKIQFKSVFGVPTGGIKIQKELEKYCINDDNLPILICDDVLTTGGSMERFKESLSLSDKNVKGIVLFSRGNCPNWIDSLFKMNF